ncbi:DUF1453 domain-containing protein [Streptomyces liangshanensis]|uniref:DUF1453 domain-containing protein n=1 Tax=Streptomyces liangshanensis TaxID=2717324 RepID=UPI0036DA085F
MSTLIDVLVAAAVVALIAARQTRPQRIAAGGRRWLVLPAILVVVALRGPGLLGAHHQALSAGLLGAELVVGLLMGAGWAATSKIWAEPDGSLWSRGTRATAAVWVLGIAVRFGLAGLGALQGVHQGTGAVLLALAASLLVRRGMLAMRSRAVRPLGAGAPAVSPKDRV